MSPCSRRSLLSALGATLSAGLWRRSEAAESPVPALRFRPFEETLRAAFADLHPGRSGSVEGLRESPPMRRIEVGDSDLIRAGVQGCHNARPFAGFPAGSLRIVRAGSAPGPSRGGVRLYVATVDVVLTGGLPEGSGSRPLDFASLPPAPTLG